MIDSDRIHKIFINCLVKNDELNEEFISVNGIVNNASFNRERIYDNKKEIVGYLEELPDIFRESSGNEGALFLGANIDKDGNVWTDQHKVMEKLFMLGIGIKKVKFIDRWMWILLPGGVPIVTYLDKRR